MTHRESVEELQRLVRDRVDAIAAHDVEALVGVPVEDVLAFNLLPPLSIRGAEQVAEQTRGWLGSYAQGPGYEVRDLQVDADEDLGFCAFLYHVTGTLRSGDPVSMWVRATLVCRRIAGRWRVVHDHESIPWDPETGQGLPDLQP